MNPPSPRRCLPFLVGYLLTRPPAPLLFHSDVNFASVGIRVHHEKVDPDLPKQHLSDLSSVSYWRSPGLRIIMQKLIIRTLKQ